MLKNLFKRAAEKGATLVEAAMVMPLLIVLAVGLAEVGFAVVDWLAVSNAAREGARVGAAAGNDASADDLILYVVGQASCAINNGELIRVTIFKVDDAGDLIGSSQNVYTPASINCAAKTASWTPQGIGWAATTRNNKIGNLDRLAVEVTFEHESVTGFMPLFKGTWTDTAVMRIEPNTRG